MFRCKCEEGAECNIDHHFLCATLRRRWKLPKHGQRRKKSLRYDLSKLMMNCDEVEEESVKDSVVDKAG